MTGRVLVKSVPTLEPDCVWPPTRLDLEPEVCLCLAHGAELPCPLCQPTPTLNRKESS